MAGAKFILGKGFSFLQQLTLDDPPNSANSSGDMSLCMYASLHCPYQTCICTKVRQLFRSRIHERTISFLYGFLKPQGRGYGFLSGYLPFSFPKVGEFEEIEISSKAESES
jgi:hypothetical protein